MKIIFIFILLFGSKLEASTSLSFNYVSDETTPVGGFKILFSQDDVSIVGESKHEFFNLFFSDLDGKIIIPDSSSHYHFISSSMSSKDFDPITVSDA